MKIFLILLFFPLITPITDYAPNVQAYNIIVETPNGGTAVGYCFNRGDGEFRIMIANPYHEVDILPIDGEFIYDACCGDWNQRHTESSAQCPPPMQCDPPPGGGTGASGCDYIDCFFSSQQQGYNADGSTWMQICYECTEMCNGVMGDQVRYCFFLNRQASTSEKINPLTPKGININDFDVLKHLVGDAPALASLRIPIMDTVKSFNRVAAV